MCPLKKVFLIIVIFMVKFMIIVLLTNFKELEFFFVLSFTFSFTEIFISIALAMLF